MPRKSGINIKCKACSKEFYIAQHRIKTAKFCSLNCQNHVQHESTRHRYTCAGCGKECIRSSSKITKFCSEECKSDTAKSTSERRKTQKAYQKLSRGNNSSRNLRTLIFRVKPKVCEKCGYNEHAFCLDLHHLDNNPNNNVLENVAVLCCMCHRKLHKGIE